MKSSKAPCIWCIFYLFLCRISPAFVWRHTRNGQKTWSFLIIRCDVTLFFVSVFWRQQASLVVLMHLISTSTRFAGLLHSKRGEGDNTSLSVTNFIYLTFSYIYSTRVADLFDAKRLEVVKTSLSVSNFTYLTFSYINSLYLCNILCK